MLARARMSPSPDTRFAPEADPPIAYMQRTRDWYLALGRPLTR